MLAYDERPTGSWAPVKLLCIANLGLATLALFSWPLLASYIAEPVGTAAEVAIGQSERPELWNYPFVLLWAFPLLGAWIAYVLQKSRYVEFARFVGALPITLIVGCSLWFWLFQVTSYGENFYAFMAYFLVTDPRSMLVWVFAICGLLLAFIASIAGMGEISKYFFAIPLLGLPAYYGWVFVVENAGHWLPQVLSWG